VSEADIRPALRRTAATLLAALSLLVIGSFGAVAVAQPSPAETPSRLRLDVDQVTPVVDAGTSTFTFTGRITNTGDRRISKLLVRLQIGSRVTTERQFTDALTSGPSDTNPTQFTTVTESLEPGQSAPVQVALPIGTAPGALKLTKAGVYPVLVNVNGTPEFGGQTRLAAVPLMVPVLTSAGKPAKATTVSVLWPIADTVPHVATWAKPLNGQLVLSDDELAADLNPGGRLNSLVSAAQTAKVGDSRVFSSLCFAIDPDLLATVDGMTRGYQVRTGTDSAPSAGKGVQAAKAWLASLRQVTSQHCVVPMPFADANLSMLAAVRSGAAQDTGLVTTAVSGADTLESILGTAPRSQVLWPAGTLDAKTLGLLPGAGIQTILTDSARSSDGTPETSPAPLNGPSVRAQPIDSLMSAALAGMPGSAQIGSSANGATAVNLTPPSDEPAVATQDGLAALAFRAGLGQGETESSGSPLLLAPPRRWNVPVAQLTTLLDKVGQYSEGGLLSPAPLSQLLDAHTDGNATMASGAEDLNSGPPAGSANALTDLDNSTVGLTGAMTVSPRFLIKPEDVVKPVREGLLRASSVAWQGAGGGSAIATANARSELDTLRSAVTVATPAQRFSVGSQSSNLPVYLTNGLPVDIVVQISLQNYVGLRPAAIPEQPIPAGRSVNRFVLPTEALRAGRLSVDVSLSTPSGLDLGTTARFQLTSNNYGVITIIVTVAAAAALLLLSGRRIYRRVKDARAAKAEGA
jgi:hypothetical protein